MVIVFFVVLLIMLFLMEDNMINYSEEIQYHFSDHILSIEDKRNFYLKSIILLLFKKNFEKNSKTKNFFHLKFFNVFSKI